MGDRLRAVRRGVGRVAREVLERGQRFDPSRLGLARAIPPLRVGFACVYRERNAEILRGILRGLPAGTAVRLWSLDGGIPSDLAASTVGSGPGKRFPLINRLVAEIPEEDRRDAFVFSDDDLRFVVGDVSHLVEVGRREALDLYQPAHSAASFASFQLVHRRPLTFMRRTRFVEQGPLVVMSARAQSLLLPLPEDLSMGYGSEIRWTSIAERDHLSLAIIDAVAVRHLFPIAQDYDPRREREILAAEVARAGLRDVSDLHIETARVGVAGALRSRLLKPWSR